MMNRDDNPIWSEKYRPRTVEDTILPQEIKNTFIEYRNSGKFTNLLINGKQGCGKTTVSQALLDEIDADYIKINGSLDRNIDILRNEITNFASTVSMSGNRKFVIIDEADGLNPNSIQPALRAFMEEYSSNCGFILTCNIKSRIIDPLQSRCSVIDFNIPSVDTKEGTKLAGQILKRCIHILNSENVEYDPKVLAQLVSKHYPDFRRLINELQRAASLGHGKITLETLTVDVKGPILSLVEILKEKNFNKMRTWVSENTDIAGPSIFRELYDSAYKFVEPSDIPSLVVLIGEYQYKAAFVADAEINLAAFLTQVMADVEFKK